VRLPFEAVHFYQTIGEITSHIMHGREKTIRPPPGGQADQVKFNPPEPQTRLTGSFLLPVVKIWKALTFCLERFV
jgi:hypothetical protein